MNAPRRSLAEEEELILSAVARLRAGIMAIIGGMFGGAGMFVATAWLVIRGGANVGQHLGLLRNYLPGYSVSWFGAFLGLLYGALIGAFLGWMTAWIYNRVAETRHPTTIAGTHGSGIRRPVGSRTQEEGHESE